MKCEECQQKPAELFCKECDEGFCSSCDKAMHAKANRKYHVRRSQCSTCKDQATHKCKNCKKLICAGCSKHHKTHSVNALNEPNVIGVYWDLCSCKPQTKAEVVYVLQEVLHYLGPPAFVKMYGDPLGTLTQKLLSNSNIENAPNLAQVPLLLLDISKMASFGITHFLFLSGGLFQAKSKLLQLFQVHPSLSLNLSLQILPMHIEDIRTVEDGSTRNRIRYYTHGYLEQGKCKVSDESGRSQLAAYLREEAFKGNIMHELNVLVQEVSTKFQVSMIEARLLVNTALTTKQLLLHEKELADESVYQYVSLRLDKLSVEALLWTLRSLKNDEMLPSEGAINSRIRESFGVKLKAREWESFWKEAQTVADMFSTYSNGASLFVVQQYVDPTGGSTTLIYPQGEEWTSYDQFSKYGDYLAMKTSAIWLEFTEYLNIFFASPGTIKKFPGGKYGAAQYLKVRGSPLLKETSLGKLSYLVQMALNEKLLKYQRTYLVSSQDFIPDTKGYNPEKLQIVKQTVIQLLSEHTNGVSFSQLPQLLRNTLPYPIPMNEIGFSKLKDLLEAMPEVVIELRTKNNPYAVLLDKIDILTLPIVTELLGLAQNILRYFKNGLTEDLLEQFIFDFKGQVDWKAFKVASLREFLTVFSRNHFKIEESSPPLILGVTAKPQAQSLPNFQTLPLTSKILQAALQQFTCEFTPYSEKLNQITANLRRAQSDKAEQTQVCVRATKHHYSLIEAWGLRPPPGFEPM